MKTSELNEKKKRHLEAIIAEMTDEDIGLASAWVHTQNKESSEKLLAALYRHHADKIIFNNS